MDGKILYANRAWREALGYSEVEVGGLSLLNIIQPSMHEHCLEMFKLVIGGEALRGIEATFVGKDGREILVEGSTNCQMVEGQPVMTRSIFRDITEKRRAEDALRAKNEELERLLAEVQQLQGILPICMYCKKVRDDQDYWQEVEAYVQEHTAAQFSHGVCPECFKKWEAERAARKH
jgi:PAS domain S-box-containing protein